MKATSGSATIVISVGELKNLLHSGVDVVLLDVRRTADEPLPEEFASGHIPGARFVDHFDELSGERTATSGKNPLPSDERIQAAVKSWGIHPDSVVVVYAGGGGGPAATRAWWVLKWAGVPDVRYLDGGLDAWIGAGGELSTEIPREGNGTLRVATGSLPVLEPEEAATRAREGVLLDARYAEAYLVEGHIPGAVSAPFTLALSDGAGVFKSDEELRAAYAALGADGSKPIGLYCGGGVGATIAALALTKLGIPAALYPGSWTQWSSDPSRPVATGNEPG
jgi:thiosulfate/3-mercaptopyruvate sulfurtransferase